MTVLYMVNKSPLMHNNLETCLRIAPPAEPILLYEDGVYAAALGTKSEALIGEALQSHPVYALKADLEARGLQRCIAGVEVIDYDGFVALVEEHDVVPWL
jgi:tRNA 2-thiouridine synthesizing protein B